MSTESRGSKSAKGVVRVWLLDLLPVVVVLAAICGGALWWVTHPKPPRNLVFVVLDTLRADRMSIYGNPRQTTPFFERNARQFLRYADVKSAASWTVPSHATMFTGLWPAQHEAQWGSILLDQRFDTLAEELSAKGFKTFGFSANLFLSEETGLTQGFDDFETVKTTPAILRKVPGALKKAVESDQRFFMFINLMDTHIPFNVRRYGKPFGVEGRGPVWAHSIKWRINAGTQALKPKDKEQMRLAYDAAVRYVDDVARDLIRILVDQELLEDTLVVFVSDHGEGLGWHPEIGHSISAWEEQLDVPLLVRLPGARRGGLVFEPTTSLVGLAPSIYDWLQVPRPAHLIEAPSLEEAAEQEVSADYRDYFSELGRKSNMDLAAAYPELAKRVSHQHVLYCDGYKLIVSAGGQRQLYDLGEDPMEQVNLVRKRPEALAMCEARYAVLAKSGRYTSFGKKSQPPDPEQVDQEKQLETLRSLGYIQ